MTSPAEIELKSSKNRTKLLSFLESARKGAIEGQYNIVLDCSNIKKMVSDAALLFKAELKIIKARSKSRIKMFPPRDDKCKQVFTQIGLAKEFGCKQVSTSDHDVVHWRAVSGTAVEGKKYAEDLMAPYKEFIYSDTMKVLWTGVQEAMTNVTDHAYIMDRNINHSMAHRDDNRWWMFSQERDGELSVLICDLGAGIPRTIPFNKSPEFRGVKRWIKMGQRSDQDILSAALKAKVTRDYPERNGEVSLSRTGESYRGNGFYNIVKTVRSIPGGAVTIHSNRGLWVSYQGNNQRKENFKRSIGGTIISWKIPLESLHEKAN